MGIFDALEDAIIKLGDNFDIDKLANRIVPNKSRPGYHSGPQLRQEGQQSAPQWRAVCQDCGMTGGLVHHVSGVQTGAPPQSRPMLPGYCKSHVSGKSNMPHRAKWEQR